MVAGRLGRGWVIEIVGVSTQKHSNTGSVDRGLFGGFVWFGWGGGLPQCLWAGGWGVCCLLVVVANSPLVLRLCPLFDCGVWVVSHWPPLCVPAGVMCTRHACRIPLVRDRPPSQGDYTRFAGGWFSRRRRLPVYRGRSCVKGAHVTIVITGRCGWLSWVVGCPVIKSLPSLGLDPFALPRCIQAYAATGWRR
jgi:hypothetical protein